MFFYLLSCMVQLKNFSFQADIPSLDEFYDKCASLF